MRLVLATTNPGKIREIHHVLDGAGFDLRTLGDYPRIAEPEETGATFFDNARLKARYYAAHTGELTVAEDSGLVIDGLDGEPGVNSARYLRADATYSERFAHIFRELETRGRRGSAAQFVCALVLARDGRILFEAEGRVEGRIATEARGTNGFGYDPIFYYPPYGRTLAEVDNDRKLAVAHRGHAFRQLREFLTHYAV
ncbi:MAG: RdgB/HAM1 family non-canonical purine NTP pyrophosphatase [Acidobacteriota bacterium]